MENFIHILLIISLASISHLKGSQVEKEEDLKLHEFALLPTDIQGYILNLVDAPNTTLLVSKTLFNKQKQFSLARAKDERIDEELSKTVNKGDRNKIIADSRLMRQLNQPFAFDLVVRLLSFAKKDKYKKRYPLVKGILTAHVRSQTVTFRDRLIALSRAHKQLQRDLIQVIRGCFPYTLPVIHSSDLPEAYRGNMEKAQAYALWSANDRILRTWVFPDTQLSLLKTISINGGEDKIVQDRHQFDAAYDPEYENLLEGDTQNL